MGERSRRVKLSYTRILICPWNKCGCLSGVQYANNAVLHYDDKEVHFKKALEYQF